MSSRPLPFPGMRPQLRRALVAAAACLALPPATASAQQSADALQAAVETYVRPLLAEPALVDAVRAHNAETKGFDDAQIAALDARWQAEIGAADMPTIAPVLHNPAAEVLTAWVEASSEMVLEILLMDARGLNVAVSHVTSDYWQGDEAKFLETFPHGTDALHIGEVEFDESSQTYGLQVSMTFPDPDSGVPIGAITVGLDAEMLQ